MSYSHSEPVLEPAFGIEAAERLAGELMPVSVAVGGEGAALLLGVLEKAGIAAEAVSGSQAGDAAGEAGAFDLAILLADAAASGNAETSSLVTAMSQASERLIFLPRKQDGALPSMPELNAWFEMFAELGYQPVVDFDAGFLAHGAFLVDRSATAAESELEAFAERLSVDGALAVSTKRVASLEAELAGGDRALQAALDAKEAELAALREENGRLSIQVEQAARRVEAADARAAQAEADAAALNAGWESLRTWVRAVVSRKAAEPAAPEQARSGLFGRIAASFRRKRTPDDPLSAALQQDASRVRASPLFDAAWYVASTPELASEGADPVLHYLTVGAARGQDPGPWFDSAEYVREHPELGSSGQNPLLHAILAEKKPGER